MPESRGRRKPKATQHHNEPATQKVAEPSPPWLVPLMLTLMIVGLIWIVTLYVTQGDYPIPGIRNWNLVIGMGMILTGFVLSTRWR